MPQWIFWTPYARAQLRNLDRTTAMRIFAALLLLREGTADMKPLTGLAPYKRIRVGDFRVVYRELGNGEFEVHAVASRGSIYKGLAAPLKHLYLSKEMSQ